MKKNAIKLSVAIAVLLFSFLQLSAQTFRNVKLQSEITTLEPLKGIVLWPDNDAMETLKSSIKLEYSYCLPCQVAIGENADGSIIYDWTAFESFLNDVKSRGHQAIVRFRYEYPGADGKMTCSTCTQNVAGATAVPLFIKNSTGYAETYNSNAGGDGNTYYADWSNVKLQTFTKQFYKDFAAKYDNDPRIAFVQVGFGHWSEYHIYGTTLKFGTNFPTKDYQAEFLKLMPSYFKETPWSISIDAADDSYTPIVETSDLMALNFGEFDDSFMHSKHDHSQCSSGDDCGYNEDNWAKLDTTTRWKNAPCGGEISYYTTNDQKNFLNPAGMYGVTWEQEAAKYHMTYVIGNDAPTGTYATAVRVLQAGQNAGYKFQITAYSVSSTQAKVTVKNIGVAPLYHNAYVTVKGIRSTTSLKGLLPGNSIECVVSGLTITDNEAPALTITSDKLLEGVSIPYKAALDGTGLSAPTVTLTASASLLKPNSSTALTATTSSDNGAISSVVIKKSDVVLATLTSVPYTYTFTPTEEGSYKFVAIVTDAKNLTATSDTLTITASNGPTEDFETLKDNFTATSGSNLKIASNATGTYTINNQLWTCNNCRIDDGTKHSTITHPSGSTMSVSVGGYIITPALAGRQTVSFAYAPGKNNKTIPFSIYSSVDNYAKALKTITIASETSVFQTATLDLSFASPVSLKITDDNTSALSSTDSQLLLDNFHYSLAATTSTSSNLAQKNDSKIMQKGTSLFFNGNDFVVKIIDLAGNVRILTSDSSIDLSSCPQGIYIVSYQSKKDSEIRKIVR